MNPKGGEQSFEVPSAQPTPHEAGVEQEQVIEQAPSAPESSPGKQAPQAVLPAVPPPVALPVTQPVTDGAAATDNAAAVPDSGLPAADTDRIEREWIDRAKMIVGQTRDDPHEQTQAMGMIKAEYNKKRFGKTVKTDDPFDGTQGRPEQSRTGDTVSA
jgi:hypothetical protein